MWEAPRPPVARMTPNTFFGMCASVSADRPAMKIPEDSGPWLVSVDVAVANFREAAEQCVHDHDVSIQAVDSRREHQVERTARTPQSIENEPRAELKELRSRNRRDAMPTNGAARRKRHSRGIRASEPHIGNALGE